jgi:hypothetical protein
MSPTRALTSGVLVFGALPLALHLALRALGLAAHTSALAGMPVDAWSPLLATLHVAVYALALVVAPIVLVAALLEGARRALHALAARIAADRARARSTARAA